MSTTHFNSSLYSRCVFMMQDDTETGLYIISVFMLSNFVVGLPANVWMLWLICHGSRETLASEIYLLNLAVCEIHFYLGLPGQLYCLHNFGNISYGLAILLYELLTMVTVARPLFLSCVCVERYIAVVHPLIFNRFKPLKYRVAQCALTWCVYSLIAALIVKFPNIRFINVIPLCLLFFCCISVLRSLKQPGPGEREGEGRRRGDKMKRKAFNIILFHLACFSVNFLPFLTVEVLKQLINIPGIFTYLTFCLVVANGLVQPLLYLHRAGKLPCVREHRPEG